MPQDKIVVNYTGPWNVKLIYFKDTGKYYSDGSYLSQRIHLWEIWDEVDQMFKKKKRPGLVDGNNEFYTLIEVPDHPYNHPRLWIPER